MAPPSYPNLPNFPVPLSPLRSKISAANCSATAQAGPDPYQQRVRRPPVSGCYTDFVTCRLWAVAQQLSDERIGNADAGPGQGNRSAVIGRQSGSDVTP